MKKADKDKHKKVKVGDLPFEDVVEGFLKVKPQKKEKSKKNKEIDKKD